jgi:acyl-CoA thioesterase
VNVPTAHTGAGDATLPSLLHDRLELVATSPGVYEIETDRTWWGHDALFGGYVEALAIRAMRTALDVPAMAPVTTSVQFFRPFVDGPFRAEVEVVRTGRSMANVHARLHSGNKLAGQAVAAFGIRRPHAEFVAAVAPPAIADAPLGAEEAEESSQLGIPTHAQFQFFPRVGTFRMGNAGSPLPRAEVGGWVRPRFATPVDEMLLVMLQDLWLPAAYHRWEQPSVAVSVDITTQFRAALPAPIAASGGVYVLLRTAGSVGGFVDEDCELWSPAGELLAQGRQLRFVH